MGAADGWKPDVHMHEACGPDLDARAHRRVFEPALGNVTAKPNICFRTPALLEREEQNIQIAGSRERAATPPSP